MGCKCILPSYQGGHGVIVKDVSFGAGTVSRYLIPSPIARWFDLVDEGLLRDQLAEDFSCSWMSQAGFKSERNQDNTDISRIQIIQIIHADIHTEEHTFFFSLFENIGKTH